MGKKTVAELLVDTLVSRGVSRIYGVAGDSLNGITDSIRRQEQLRWIHVRHEETAAFAAGAEAHLTGTLGRLRRQLRSRQPAPDQRPLRLPPQPRSRARHRGADSRAMRSAAAISRRPTRSISSRSAATTANWCPSPSRCRACWRSRCRPRSRGAAWRSSPCPEMSPCATPSSRTAAPAFSRAEADRVPVR